MDVAALARSVGNTPTTSDLDWEEIDVTPVTRLLLGLSCAELVNLGRIAETVRTILINPTVLFGRGENVCQINGRNRNRKAKSARWRILTFVGGETWIGI